MIRLTSAFATRCLFIIFVYVHAAQAQFSNVSDVESTPVAGVGHHYMGVLNETVNPANGSVSLRIASQIPDGRKLTLPFSFAYDSDGAIPITSAYQIMPPLFKAGWSYTIPMMTSVRSYQKGQFGGDPIFCTLWSGYVFYDADGARHAFPQIASLSTSQLQSCEDMGYSNNLSGGDDFLSATQNTGSFTVQDADGTTYFFSGGVGSSQGVSTLATSVEDRNGNVINYTNNGSGVFSATDTAGRTVVSSNGFGATGNTVTVSGLANSYSLTWGTTATWNYNTGQTLIYTPSNATCGSTPLYVTPAGSSAVVSSITMPNGQVYKFYYDSTYGLLNEIIYPTGGYVKYTWGFNSSSEMALGGATIPDGENQIPSHCYYRFGNPAITKRQVSYDGSTVAEEQDFSYGPTTWSGANGTFQASQWSTKTTTVTTHDNVRSKSFTTSYTYAPHSTPLPADQPAAMGSQVPVEQQVIYYNWDGSTLRTVNKTWTDISLLSSEQTVLPNGTTSQINYSYGNLGVLTEKDEYDYGLTLTRKTLNTYESFPANALGSYVYDQPCRTLIEDGGSNPYAETDYYYDNGSTATVCGAAGTPSVTGVSNLTNHDETNFGPSSTLPRGNATTITKKCFQGSAACSIGNSTTTQTYDETGQVLSMVDACGNGSCPDMTGTNHTTTYSYADSYSSGTAPAQTNAFLTTITYPTPADNVAETKSFQYAYADGQLTFSTDENSQITTYKYATQPTGCSYPDQLDRLTEVDYPDGGQTTNCYNDAGLSVSTSKLITSSLTMTNVAITDGLGHTVQTQLTTDPDGTDYVATTYDGLGNVYTRSNPYRTTASTTDGTTTYTYDALGRTTTVAQPDGSTVSTSYGANSTGFLTTVTDEIGNQRTTQTDGLGRLKMVWEAPNVTGYNYETDYGYDQLDDLLTVTQKGSAPGDSTKWRNRSFTYDSLSRLTQAVNPESGTISYSYDLNGNVVTKSAPSPNLAPVGNTVTTNYSYDVLNRILGKSYLDTYASNPATTLVKYGYDAKALTSCPAAAPPGATDSYPKGRRTSMCDGSGGVNWTHDKIGRTLQEVRTIGTVTGKHDTDAYNLDGSIASITSLGYGVSYTYSGAGRSIYLAGGNTYVQNNTVTYAPFGGLTSAKLGPSSIVVTNAYNSRLQPLLISATGASTIMSLCYDFHMVKQPTPNTACELAVGSGDNGNVSQILNNRDNNRTQNFLYDPLNRISQAYTSGSNWGETFGPTATNPGVQPTAPGIDSWGNLIDRSPVNGKTLTEGLTCLANTKNQLTTCSLNYDVAGNLIQNGSTAYTYDAENRLVATAGMSYVYDGDGKRVEKCSEGTTAGTCASNATGTLYWTAWGSDPLAETDLAGNVLENYIFFNGRRIARREPTPVTVHFYFSDDLGTHSLITDLNGDMPPQEESDYFPYGGEIPVSGSDSNHYKFTGKERDVETCTTACLDYFGARHYASNQGRFLHPDKVLVSRSRMSDPQLWNMYSYTRNNPLSFIDPDGLEAVEIELFWRTDWIPTGHAYVPGDLLAAGGSAITMEPPAKVWPGSNPWGSGGTNTAHNLAVADASMGPMCPPACSLEYGANSAEYRLVADFRIDPSDSSKSIATLSESRLPNSESIYAPGGNTKWASGTTGPSSDEYAFDVLKPNIRGLSDSNLAALRNELDRQLGPEHGFDDALWQAYVATVFEQSNRRHKHKKRHDPDRPHGDAM